MVVALSIEQLLVIGLDVLADWLGGAKIERRAGDILQTAVRQQFFVDRRIRIRHQLQLVSQDGAAVVARDVEIGMIGQVDDRVLVRHGIIGNIDALVCCQRVGHGAVQIARVAGFTVRTVIGQTHGRFVAIAEDLISPDLSLEGIRQAVQIVRPIVGNKLIMFAVEVKGRPADAVGIAADGRTMEWIVRVFISGQRVIAEDHVDDRTIWAGNKQGLDRRAIGDQMAAQAACIGQNQLFNGCAGFGCTEGFDCDAHDYLPISKLLHVFIHDLF